MAVEKLTSTTLTAALTENVNDFYVASTSGVTVGDYLVCRAEAMKVQEVPSSTQVRVARGVNGTAARAHPASAVVYVGSPEKFQAIKDSLTAIVGDSGAYPDFLLPGQRAMDSAGNEYILLELTEVVYTGVTVMIEPGLAFHAFPPTLLGGRNGSVALAVDAGTSDQYIWGQIYGYNSYAQTAIAGTSAYAPEVQASATTPKVGMSPQLVADNQDSIYQIYGMFITGGATTGSASSSRVAYSVPVWLNYPYMTNYGSVLGTSGGA